MAQCGTLVFFCGKMAAGKSTKAKAYAAEHNAVLLSEDAWLSALYPEQISNVQDYLKYSGYLKSVLHSHVQSILNVGGDVVMDFPGNTQQQRQWFLDIARAANVQHRMLYLERSDDQCLEQLKQRRLERPERAQFDTEANFRLISSFFEPPLHSEGLSIELIDC